MTVEASAHKLLAEFRVNGSREFFGVSVKEAINAINEASLPHVAIGDFQDGNNPKRMAAVRRLRSIPAVFTLDDLMSTTDWSRKIAAQICWEWKEASLIKLLGPRNVGVYYNLVADMTAAVTRQGEALRKMGYDRMIVIGSQALHDWDVGAVGIWGTLEVAVPICRGKASVPTLDGIRLIPYYQERFDILWENVRKSADSEGRTSALAWLHGLPTALPEFAYANAFLSALRKKGGWAPDRFTIEKSDAQTIAMVRNALLTLGANIAEMARFESWVPTLIPESVQFVW